GCITGIVGLIIYFTAQNAPNVENTRDALIFLFLFWLIIPILGSLPYLATGSVDGLGSAYFESVSAITTTGASILIPEEIGKSLLVWRSLLQWCGGVFTACFAIVIFAALNLSGTGVHRSVLFTLKKGELFSRLIHIGRIISLVYFLIALVCFVLLVIFKTPVFEAFCLALSAVSTGGLVPRTGELGNYVPKIGGLVLAVTCLLGAADIAILWDIVRHRNIRFVKAFFTNVENRGLLSIIAILVIIGFAYTGHMHIHTLVVEATFMVSTTGFDYHVIGVDVIPPALLITICLIGGSALSTAGGVKIIRTLLLMRHMRTDIDRMSHPSRVKPVRFQGNIIDDNAFLSIWMYFFAYTLVFAIGIMALGASGLELTHAVSACASALSNTGPLLAATYPELTYEAMTPMTRFYLTIIMLLGRIEVLAAFAVISPSMWRN
ncbi:MAG: TrkH family potassium uptake protein, partial [Robiginitomaculum sp.]|nr:TrkH family potassium uptake protein [Robiginitomaculum sp.]